MVDAVSYGIAPDEGTVLTWGAQSYRLGKVFTFTVGGEYAAELNWVTMCPGCGKEYNQATGLRKRYLRKRCKGCDPKGDVDKAERRAWAAAAWQKRMADARAAKSDAFKFVGLEGCELNDWDALACTVVLSNGKTAKRIEFQYVEGADYAGEKEAIQAGLGHMAAKREDLMALRLLGG